MWGLYVDALPRLLNRARRFFPHGAAAEMWAELAPALDRAPHQDAFMAQGSLCLLLPYHALKPGRRQGEVRVVWGMCHACGNLCVVGAWCVMHCPRRTAAAVGGGCMGRGAPSSAARVAEGGPQRPLGRAVARTACTVRTAGFALLVPRCWYTLSL